MPINAPRFASRTRVICAVVAILFAMSILVHQMYFAITAQAVSSSVVISQVYGGGGNAGATFRNDFIEIFNKGTSPISLAGWTVQYASATGTSWTNSTALSGTIQPGQYYLIQESAGAGGTTSLPTPDATGSIAMSATAGKVALVNSATALTGSGCPFGATVVDFIGYGAVNCSEGSSAATLTNTTASLRASNGCTDTDNNSTDFASGAPNPRNTASATNSCGGASTNPSGVGAANPSSVAPNTSTLLTVAVTPGTNPTSTAHTVSANLSSIGGSASQSFFDNGSNGDVTPNDNVFSFNATVATGTSGGLKTLPATITETSPLNRTGSTSISLTVLGTSNPSGVGAATPNSVLPGDSSTLTVTVTPGTNPASTGLAVTADLSTIGGSSTQQFFDDGSNGDVTPGNNVFTYATTIPNGTSPGAKSLPFSVTDAQARSGTGSISLTIQTPPPPVDHVVISQLYGGGGNTGAPFTNDYIELYNPTGVPFTLTGWSLQYASAAGTSWTNKQPLGGTIAPGEYYLVSLASGAVGSPLPVIPNISGDINMSATTGKIALVNNSDSLTGACPVGANAHIVDFLGYGGSSTCHEGAANAPAPSNTAALFRKTNGSTDTDQNGSDFITGVPSPRRTAPIVELGPWVAGTDPITDGFNAPHDATLTVNFSEPVDVTGNWFNITCTSTGLHNSATVASSNNFKAYAITPNTNFQFGEQCTVTIVKDGIHDQDLDDSNPNTDTLFEDYVWTFTVVGAGSPAPYPPSVHLTMGNPSNAVADLLQPNNYLMEKPTYSLSYNRDKGTPNWVSWHLDTSWFGSLARIDTFRADPAVPPDWYRVQGTDFFATGFDRGHMTPNADRDNENRIPINQETYLMSNMVPQAPDNNQGPWANLENDLRSILTTGGDNEIYIVSGPLGVGGSGSNGGTTTTVAGGHVTVPAYTWKVALVLPKGDDDVSRVTASTRTIAILMPNTQGIRNDPWQNYLTTVDNIEALTGYDFFANVPDAIENSIEAGINGVNPPGTAGQAVTTAEDTSKSITLTAVSPNANPLSYTIVSSTTHGILTGTAENRSYAPDPDFNGTDSFSFKVNDGSRDSNTSTVNITVTEVNDPPVANNDAENAVEDTILNFPASDLTVNDSAGPANESGQNLTVTAVNATADTHGSVSLTTGTISYSPSANYNGPASFEYQVCDDGTTSGSPDSKCATGTVNITVAAVNDDAVMSPSGSALANESCPPANGAIDPGENVSVSLQLTNIGTDPTTNLVATLQPNANVLVPSGPVNYGSIGPTGAAGRNFTFTANGACGEVITLTLQLQDGVFNLGTVSYTFTLGCNTACAGAPRISTSTTLSCDSGDTVATITVNNTGTATATNVMLATARLGAVNGTILPQNIGSLAPGTSSVRTVTFSGAPSGSQTLQVGGSFTGGTFNSSRRVTAPACNTASLWHIEVPFLPSVPAWLPVAVLSQF